MTHDALHAWPVLGVYHLIWVYKLKVESTAAVEEDDQDDQVDQVEEDDQGEKPEIENAEEEET